MAHGHGGGGGFFHEDEILGKAYDERLMRWLLSWLRPYRMQVAVAFVIIILLSIAIGLPAGQTFAKGGGGHSGGSHSSGAHSSGGHVYRGTAQPGFRTKPVRWVHGRRAGNELPEL